MTHTYALLTVSKEAYEEIRKRLVDAGYAHAIDDGEIDMHGIALTTKCSEAAYRYAWRSQRARDRRSRDAR